MRKAKCARRSQSEAEPTADEELQVTTSAARMTRGSRVWMKIEGREVLVTVERASKYNAKVKKCSRWVWRILFPKEFNDGTSVYEEEGASPTRKLQEKHSGQFMLLVTVGCRKNRMS